VLAELAVPPVRYVVWSNDMNYVALVSKHCRSHTRPRAWTGSATRRLTPCARSPAITLATKTLEQLSVLHETIRIKGGVWDDTGVFIYTTLNHLKYALVAGYARRRGVRVCRSRAA
jgi:coatomer subunit alpha